MRILAVDPGSQATAFAYFDGDELVGTALVRPRGSTLSWLERLEHIADESRELAATSGWAPEVLAVEETVAFRASVNVGFILARGYLLRVISGELFPGVQVVEVNLSTVRRALGLRANEKRAVRQAAARLRFPGCSQDEADAACVGLGAMRIAAERLAAV